MHLALDIDGLTLTRRGRAILAGVDLAVPRGAILGLIGPNGSGKTSLMRCIVGLVWPTSGRMEVLGHEMPAGRVDVVGRVSAIIERPSFYSYLTASENMLAAGRTSGLAEDRLVERIPRLIEAVGLTTGPRARTVKSYSEGERQRLGLAASLLTDPDLVLLDEPSNGLDPDGRRDLLRILKAYQGLGRTIVISSHVFPEIRDACSHVAVLRRGRIQWCGSIDELPGGSIDDIYFRYANLPEFGTASAEEVSR